MKTITTILFPALVLLLTACGGNSGNSSNSNVETPEMDIHTAVFMNEMQVVKQHVEAGSDLDIREPLVGSTPLISASVFGKTEIAKQLIEGGADVNIQNNEGSTALHSAAFLGRIEIVRLLLAKGAETNLRNNAGSSAYESVAGPFEEVKPIYDIFSRDLGPLGLKLDYEELETIRPQIADLLK